MKKLILAVAFLSASQGFAASTGQVLAQVSVNRGGISDVTLFDDGRLEVTDFNDVNHQIQLKDATFQELKSDAARVAAAELQTTHRDRVCKFVMMPYSPTLKTAGYDNGKGEFTSEIEVRLTAEHCGIADVTRPIERQAYGEAVGLREQLVILALELTQK